MINGKFIISPDRLGIDNIALPLIAINRNNVIYANKLFLALTKTKLNDLSYFKITEIKKDDNQFGLVNINITSSEKGNISFNFRTMIREVNTPTNTYRMYLVIQQESLAESDLHFIEHSFNLAINVARSRYIDILTEIYNRSFYLDVLSQDFINLFFQQSNVSYLLININQFNKVNAFYSVEVGDWLLKELCGYITAFANKQVVIMRMAGDEFLVITKEISNEKLLELYDGLTTTRHLGDLKIIFDARISYHHSSIELFKVEEIYPKLSSVLNFAKEEKRGLIKYEQKYYDIAINQLNFPQYLATLFDEDRFYLMFQPVVNDLGELFGFESLIRLNLDGQYQSPHVFIEYLIQNNFTHQLNEIVLKQLVKVISTKSWQGKFANHKLKISINIVPTLSNFIDHLKVLVGIYQENIQHFKNITLEFELLERQFMLSDGSEESLFNEIQDLLESNKISLALDDFGIGHSSLERIIKCKFDTLKIDKAFTDKIIEKNQIGERALMVIQMILLFSHKTGAKIVIEGVETQEQFEILKLIGAKYFQGYLFYKPSTVEQVINEPFIFNA